MSSEIDEFRSSLVAAVQAELERHASAVVAEVDRLREEGKRERALLADRAHRSDAGSRPRPSSSRRHGATVRSTTCARRSSSDCAESEAASDTPSRRHGLGPRRSGPGRGTPADAGDARRAGCSDPEGRHARRQPAQVRRAGGPHGHLLQRRQPEHGAPPGRDERGAQGRHRRPRRPRSRVWSRRTTRPSVASRTRSAKPPRRRSTTPRIASTTVCWLPRVV